MEIERKFLPLMEQLPFHPEDFPCRRIEQGYLCTNPVVRIRRDNDEYYLTYKSKGLLVREEYNLPLTPEGYGHLKLELDIFEGDLAPLIIAEIEFPDEETARAYQPPKWLGEDVTYSPLYHNSVLSSPDTDIPSLNISRQQD